jgi:hypothetical protein
MQTTLGLHSLKFAASTTLAGSVDVYANLPTPSPINNGVMYYVKQGSGGSWIRNAFSSYQYPQGFYISDGVSWNKSEIEVKVSEDSTSLVNINDWAAYLSTSPSFNIGDAIIFNSKYYINLTGASTSNAPNIDTVNWISQITLDNIVMGATGQKLSYNNDDYTLNIETGLGPVLQVGQELYVVVYNDTGSIIPNAAAVNGISIANDRISVSLANSTYHNGIANTYITTMEIGIASYGLVTFFGVVRDVNTSLISGGGPRLFIDHVTDGKLTRTKPEFPNYSIQVGAILKEGVTDGIIFIRIQDRSRDTLFNAWDGSIRETINFTVDSADGITITGSLSSADNLDNLTLIFSDGFTLFDVSTPATLTLTAGTATVAQPNYVYIDKATKTLQASTSDWPTTTEHARVAEVAVFTASRTKLEGAYRNQNWNDHVKTTNDNGHLLHLAEAIREKIPATHKSGTAGSAIPGAGGVNMFVQATAGVIKQLHRQNFPLINTVPYAIDAVNQGSKTFTITDDGDLSSIFPDGRPIHISGSTGNDKVYTIASTNYSAPNFNIIVNETIPDATADGDIGDFVIITNDFTTPNIAVQSLTDITTDASGVSLLNTSFSVVLGGVINKGGQVSHLLANFPVSTYNKNFPDQAVQDAQNHSVYDGPTVLSGVYFLIARFTFVDNGGVWSVYDTEDLRGRTPNTSAGGGAGGAGVTDYTGLTDTPNSNAGQKFKIPQVNESETGHEYTSIPSLNGVKQTVQTLTDGASIAFNMNSGYNAKVTVAGDRTMAAPTNIPVGGGGVITITCDATDRTITWNAAYRFVGGVTQTAFEASSVNEVMWYSPDGVNVTIMGVKYNVS